MTGLGSQNSTTVTSVGGTHRNGRAVYDPENKTRIKFTRKFTHQYRPCYCILASLIVSLLSASIVSYCGYLYVQVESGEELSFHGSFTVVHDDSYRPGAFNSSAEFYKLKNTVYVKALEKAVRVRPGLRLSFMSADILALDGEEELNITVHFGLKFNPRLLFGSDLQDLIAVLKGNLRIPNSIVDVSSITLREVRSVSMMSSSSLSPKVPPHSYMLDDNFSNNAAQCAPVLQLPFCPHAGNNLTSYPNLFGHRSADDIENDLIIFRELIDAECFDHAAEFLCEVLQPKCVRLPDSTIETYLPCQKFCKDFFAGCGDRFNDQLRESFDCAKFPEYSQFGRSCHKQPSCDMASLKTNDPFSYRLCDGVVDCLDLGDELSCSYCDNELHCGVTKNCISATSYCDDVSDCPDESDEKNCFTLNPHLISGLKYKTALDVANPSEGYAQYASKGTLAYVCVDEDNVNHTLIQKTGESFCKKNSYKKLEKVDSKPIESDHLNFNYVHLDYAGGAEVTFQPVNNCMSDHLLYVSCSDVECGLQTARTNTNSLDGLKKLATLGDWPWQAALFKNGVHSCDASLISESWLLTTISCFQGQNKAEWIARLGTVRLNSKSPWQQERHVIGMVKSPVEGSTLVLLKLSTPVIYSHFVRPVCLPFNHPPTEELTYCNSLGWTKTKGMLQRIEVKETLMDACADMSITNNNGLCATSVYETDECNEEEMAGSSMVCLTTQQSKWVLIGISNWRISCTPVEMRRPRLYDMLVTNVNWIRGVINEA